MKDARPRVGISACLLGKTVRYDGGHKRDRLFVETLSGEFEWVPVCPEVELGLGVPREPIQRVDTADGVRLQTVITEQDLTDRMRIFAAERARQLAEQNLSGFVFKQDSPSCGLRRVKLHGRVGPARKQGRGLFAEALIECLPDLPVEEEGRLSDPEILAHWIERVRAYASQE